MPWPGCLSVLISQSLTSLVGHCDMAYGILCRIRHNKQHDHWSYSQRCHLFQHACIRLNIIWRWSMYLVPIYSALWWTFDVTCNLSLAMHSCFCWNTLKFTDVHCLNSTLFLFGKKLVKLQCSGVEAMFMNKNIKFWSRKN